MLSSFHFHSDISNFLYFADSPYKNYEYHKSFTEQLGIHVISGNIQSGFNFYSQEEPSALYMSFKVINNPFIAHRFKVPYYPRYRALNPFQRCEYLKFLQNPYQPAEIGYCFLLLYCLERRLSEGKEEVIPVIKKLADYHGGKFKNVAYRTLHRYELWKSGDRFPQNAKVYSNYTLYFGCYENKDG